MERGAADHDAADLDRGKDGHRGDGAGTTDLKLDINDGGDRLTGGEFESDGPAGGTALFAEIALQSQVIDLDDHAVDLVGEFLSPGDQIVVAGDDLRRTLHQFGLRKVDTETEVAQSLQRGKMVGWELAGHGTKAVAEDCQWSFGGDAGVELSQRSSGGIAGVGKGGGAALFQFPIPFLKGFLVNIDLAANLEKLRVISAQAQGDTGNGAEIFNNLFADNAVAAGGAINQDAFFIDQFDGESVKFDFTDILYLFKSSPLFFDTIVKVVKFGFIAGVIERKHRHTVAIR